MYSVVIPVYRNEESISSLLIECEQISVAIRNRFAMTVEFVFVVDGSPDNSFALLKRQLPQAAFPSQLILHARNFGSFAAIRTGLADGRGDYFGVIAADLQEPPELLSDFLAALLEDNTDIAVGIRQSRVDPPISRYSANLFWWIYRKLVMSEIPKGGVDAFGCTKRIRNELLSLRESNSSLVALVIWIGFRRAEIPYVRRARAFGKSAWTLGKKVNYLSDSIFSFTDLPIRVLTASGLLGLSCALILALLVGIARIAGWITVPGYTATAILIIFFGGLNTFGLGLIGSYAWRTYENTKRRPWAIFQSKETFEGISIRSQISEGS